MSLPDKNSYAALGGELSDYAPPVDATTDLPAAASDDAMADVAQMTRTAVRCFATFTADDPAALIDHDAVWGNDISVAPTVVRTGGNTFTVTWPASVTDVRGVVRPLNLRRGWGNGETASSAVRVTRLSPNSVRVVATEIEQVTVFVL